MNNLLTTSEAAKILRITTITLREWEKQGKISPYKTKGGFRRYTLEMLKEIKKQNRNIILRNEISEELFEIPSSPSYYLTKSLKIYRKISKNKFYEIKNRNYVSNYIYVTLDKTRRFHRVIAETFIPNPNNYPIVGHKDNNKINNNIENLYWTTYSENSQKAVKDGLLVNDKGYDDSQSKPVICFDLNFKEIARYGSEREAHRQLGVSVSTVTRHCKGEIKGKTRCGYYFKYDIKTK